jgi:hypothetical protein
VEDGDGGGDRVAFGGGQERNALVEERCAARDDVRDHLAPAAFNDP